MEAVLPFPLAHTLPGLAFAMVSCVVFCGRNGVEEETGGLFELKAFGGAGTDGHEVSSIHCSLSSKLLSTSSTDL